MYPHANDILCDKDDNKRYNKCLYERGKRTIDYLNSLSKKNIKEQCDVMRMQDNLLLEIADAKVELVYSSRIMNDDVKERIEQVSTLLRVDGYSANVSFMECPSVSEGNFTSILSGDDISAHVLEPEQSEVDENL
jgi:exo-beta-1,3-glucanase (GH17 family)